MDNENINNEVNTDLQEQGEGLNGAQSTDNTVQTEKTFTQQQLNDIVEKRLAKERKRLMGMIADDEATKAELARNRLQLAVTKRLTDEGRPADLAELLDYSDEDKCNASYNKVVEVFDKAVNKKVDERFKAHGRIPYGSNAAAGGEPGGGLRSAFGLSRGD